MLLLIVYLLIAIGVSFLCSILEAILLSVTPAYVADLESRKPGTGYHLRRQKEDIDRPLSAILSLNTIAHTIGAAGVGAQAQIVFGKAYVTAASVVLTLAILVFSEIIPKTIGATFWRSLAPSAARILRIFIPLLYPFVFISQYITLLVSGKKRRRMFHRHELSAYADIGVEEGEIREQQSRIVKNLVRLDSLRAKDIMTPRPVVVCYPDSATVEDVIDDPNSTSLARYPVYGKSSDEVTGYVLRDDLMEQYAAGTKGIPLSKLRRNALLVPDLVRVGDLFERMLEESEQMAVLINEYGGFSGLTTVEDVVETLIGMDIVDEEDTVSNRRILARERWKQRALRLGIYTEHSDTEDTHNKEGEEPSKDGGAPKDEQV